MRMVGIEPARTYRLRRTLTLVFATLGAALALLAAVGTRGAEASFPGTNGEIIFRSDRDASLGGPGLYTVTPGSTAQRLPGTLPGDIHAVWSPDGSRIAFQSASRTDQDISVMNADGSERRVVTDTTLRVAERTPTWSPDGSRVAFVAGDSGTDTTNDLEIWTINVDGSGLAQLTDNAQNIEDKQPSWSPDGEQIAFVSEGRPGQTNSDIYVMDANPATSDAGALNLTPNTSDPVYQFNDENPNWSPDGSQIAYDTVGDVWKINANGTGRTNLTPGSESNGSEPSWSPDGSSIVYVKADGTDRNIYRMDTAGGNQTPVDTTPRGDVMPDWQPTLSPDGSPMCDITGTANNDSLAGTAADETICGLGGNDRVDGGGGEDVLIGGAGDDTLTAPAGRTTINGGAGKDVASFAGSATAIEANLQTDFVRRLTTAPLQGAALVDVEGITGSGNDDSLRGSTAADTLTGGLGADTILALSGNDRINSKDGVKGNDTINASKGKDRCVTDRNENSIRGCE